MAKNDVPKFEDTEPLFEDTEPIDGEEATASTKSFDTQESFNKGVQQGATFGGGDEFQGFVEGAMDQLRKFGIDPTVSIFEGMKADGPAVSEVNAKLAADGFKGDIGPKSTLGMYRQARDAARVDNDLAMKQNPGAFLAGGITGGLVTAPVMPGALAAPFGKAAQGASVLSKMELAARNATPLAAIGGFGLAGGDVLESPDKVAADTVVNTGVGQLAGGAITGAVEVGKKALTPIAQGLGNLVGKAIPKTMKTAYRRGVDGVDTTTPEWSGKIDGQTNQIVDEVTDPLIAKSQSQNKAYYDNVDDLEKQILKMQEQQKLDLDLGKQRQAAQNAADIAAVNKRTVEAAKQTQTYMGEVKAKLGKAFDIIDDAAEKSGVAPENRDVIGDFMQMVEEQAGIPETESAAILKKLEPMLGKKDIQSFRNLKNTLTKYFENNNPTIKKAAKQAYSALKNNYAKELQANGYDELAAKMSETNQRWSALAELQDSFVDNINKNRITKEIQASPDTINAITNFNEKGPKQIADAEFMTNLMKTADPQGSKAALNTIAGAAEDMTAVKGLPKDVPVLPNPKLAQLEQLLSQAKARDPLTGQVPNPGELPGLGLPAAPQQVKDELTKLLPKYGMESSNLVSKNKLERILDFLKQEKGEEFVSKVKTTLGPLNEDIALQSAQAGQGDSGVAMGAKGMALKALGGVNKTANAVGRGVKKTSDLVDDAFNKDLFQAKPKTDSKEFLSKGVKYLSDSTPEGIEQLSAKMAQTSEEGKRYANVLLESARKNRTSKNAIMFGLMQQPKFRELMQNMVNDDENNVEP